MNIVTLVSSERLPPTAVPAVVEALRAAGGYTSPTVWVDEDVAIDVPFTAIDRAKARAVVEAAVKSTGEVVDVIVQTLAPRVKRLLVADMDSTMITVECIDELADYAGVKPQVAMVTEAAMRGELDFEGALDARVALLEGLPAKIVDECYAERVRLMPGARTLVRTMRAHGARTVLVSGGFTVFAEPVAQAIGFDTVIANRLSIKDGRLMGKVERPIVDADVKRATLIEEAKMFGISLADCLAVGDGANDIPMIEAAGLGVAYHAKPRTCAAADVTIRHGDLTVLLHAQGYARRDWVD